MMYSLKGAMEVVCVVMLKRARGVMCVERFKVRQGNCVRCEVLNVN